MGSTLEYYEFQLKRSFDRFVKSPYFGWKKFFNMISLFLQFLLLKPAKVRALPVKISFDPCSNCMLACPLCPTGQGKKGRSRGSMKFSNFRKVVDEVGDYLYEIDLNNWGEPFLNKDVYEMAEYAHKKRIKTSINTNLNVPFSEEDAERIVKSGLDQLYISIDGITQKVYEKYRAKGKLDIIKKNIKLVVKKKKELGSKTPKIVWQFLIMEHNKHQIPLLPEFRDRLGIDKLVKGNVRCDLAEEIFKKDEDKIKDTKDFLPKEGELSRYDYEKKQRKVQKKICHFLWLVSVINWNGSVSPCCGNYYERMDFGNAFKDGFRKVWNNKMYQSARNAVAGRPYSEPTVCLNCLKTGFID